MKSLVRTSCLALSLVILMVSCGTKPAYKTRDGKKKLKYYNELQYRGD